MRDVSKIKIWENEPVLTKADKNDFINFMMDCNVLRFGDFVTKSGRNTPYFINTGNYTTGKQSAKLGEYYAMKLYESVGTDFDCMFGPAYKGIPLVVSCAGKFAELVAFKGDDKPFCFNRKEVKDHGEGGNIVGYQPKDGDNVVIIEDVITAGTAIRETLPILNGAAKDLQVTDMIISVDRCEVGKSGDKTAVQEVYDEFGIKVHPIITVKDIYNYFADKADSDEEAAKRMAAMKAYMDKYCVL